MTFTGLSGKRYQTETKAFSSGGEGDIFGIVGMNDKVVKIYHSDRISNELEEKLKTMVRRPPSSAVLTQVAWPLDTVYDNKGCFCGFVMPRLSITAELNEIYTYPPKTNITYKQKLILAQNICVVISEVHKAGYVFGDFNPRNIGINTNTGSVAFLDTDSYHIVDGNKTYRCKVCLDGYVAPELLKKCEAYKKDAYASAPLPTFTKETDNFALAIHIFKLLMNGFTPFNGIKETERASTASPGVGNQAIKRDEYCFKPGNKPMSPAVPSLDALPDTIAELFTRAFMYGKIDPKERPSAVEWHKALSNYEASLVKCSRNGTHMYKKGLSTCPWCKADERYKTATAPVIKQKGFSSPVLPTTPPTSSYGSSASLSRSQQGVTSSVTGTPISANASTGAKPYTTPAKVKDKRATYQALNKISWISFLLYSALIVYIFFFSEGYGHNVDLGLITIGYLLIIASWAFFHGAIDGGSSELILPTGFVFCLYGAAVLGSVILNKYYYGWGDLGWFDHLLLDVLGRNQYLALKMIIVAPATSAVIVWIAGLLGKRLKK